MRTFKRLFMLVVLCLITGINSATAQCAMCRVSLENNVSNGEIGIAENLNTGIIYLFVMPYLAVAVVGFLWYRKSKGYERFSGSH
jgi:hypothetical protein